MIEQPDALNGKMVMTTEEYIHDLCKQVINAFHPQKIVLFGSHAYGRPGPDSDVDLLVVMPFDERPVQQAIKIRSQINTPLPVERAGSHVGTDQREVRDGRFLHTQDYGAWEGHYGSRSQVSGYIKPKVIGLRPNVKFAPERIQIRTLPVSMPSSVQRNILKLDFRKPELHSAKRAIWRIFINLVLPVEPTWATLRPDLDVLTVFAVDYR